MDTIQTRKPQPVVETQGQVVKETWANGGQLWHFCGETMYVSGIAHSGKMWSKSVRRGVHNHSWKPDTVIRRGGKDWIWDIGPDGPIWVPYCG
jgi:hypothetical protein